MSWESTSISAAECKAEKRRREEEWAAEAERSRQRALDGSEDGSCDHDDDLDVDDEEDTSDEEDSELEPG